MNTSPSLSRRRTLAALATFAAFGPPAVSRALKIAAPSPEDIAAFASNSNAFSLDLYRDLLRNEGPNIFLSPLSLSTALAILDTGARGETSSEIRSVLHSALADHIFHPAAGALSNVLTQLDEGKDIELKIANALWGENNFPFRDEFLLFNRRIFSANLESLDFSGGPERARVRINRWVARETRDRIRDLMPSRSINADTVLVITNAIYFKGRWALPFPKAATADAPFYQDDGSTATVPLMRLQDELPCAETDEALLVDLPYRGDRLAMTLVVPRQRDGLRKIEAAGLSGKVLKEWSAKLAPRQVRVFVPRFKLEDQFVANEPLQRLGLKRVFTPDADLSGMTAEGRFFVTTVVHKSFVEVNEEGSEAAAATGIAVGRLAAPAEPLEIRADHPFLFAIRDRETGAFLFLGRLAQL